ncbi:MAG: hypothetical protein R2705_19460 [Ilumatobacteraceae bacterium]
MRFAIVELLLAMDVYRTYVELPARRPSVADLTVVHRFLGRIECDGVEREALDAVGSVLRGELEAPGTSAFVYRFQQTSGPVMAKGIEDTAMYRYTRMIALNEVGADPARFGRTVSSSMPPTCIGRSTGHSRCSLPRPTTRSVPRTSGPGSRC